MSRDRDDEIGYGKPPRYTRFRKGQSGNPNGRPKGTGRKVQKANNHNPSTEHDDTVRRLNNRKIVIKVAGKPTEVTLFEAVALKQQANALEGSVTAQREIMRAKERLDERDARRQLEAEKKEREKALEEKERARRLYHYLVTLQAEQDKVYREAAEAGRQPEPRYPHPDDFVIDHNRQTATIIGPWDEDDALYYRKLAKRRDFHLIEYVILCRQRPKGSLFKQRLAAFESTSYDQLLPRRQQLQHETRTDTLGLLFSLPMADLRAWRSELHLWIRLNPLPQPDKHTRKETYRYVNKLMQPVLKQQGFRSLAQLKRHCEDEAI